MEGIEFEEQKQNYDIRVRKTAFLPSLIIRFSRGKIETENQANLVLSVFAAAAIILSFYLFFSSAQQPSPQSNQFVKVAGPTGDALKR